MPEIPVLVAGAGGAFQKALHVPGEVQPTQVQLVSGRRPPALPGGPMLKPFLQCLQNTW